jgi:hypothetical protein
VQIQIGRKIYYEKITGNIIQDTGERSGNVVETTPEQDFASYQALAERVPETVGLLQLEYGQYMEDFQKSSSVRVDVTVAEPALLFSFPPELGEEQPEEPIYQPTTQQRLTSLETNSINTMIAVTESFEIQQAADGQREQETTNTMLALAEAYETILQQQDTIAAIIARVEALEAQTGGES